MSKSTVDYPEGYDPTEYDTGHGPYRLVYYVNLKGYCVNIGDKTHVALMKDKKHAALVCKQMNERKPELWELYE